jgi:hypothetical protein
VLDGALDGMVVGVSEGVLDGALDGETDGDFVGLSVGDVQMPNSMLYLLSNFGLESSTGPSPPSIHTLYHPGKFSSSPSAQHIPSPPESRIVNV